MKNIFKLALATFVFVPMTSFAAAIDPQLSKLTWHASKKIGDSHTGTIKVASGEVTFEKNNLKSGNIVVDMKTITNTDIKDASFKKKLETHLSSEDFFNVEKNPTSTLKIKSVKALEAGKSEITADLTIRGKTETITFPVEVSSANGQYTAKGKIKLDRTKFDIKYGSSNFFKLAADKIINNEFELEFEVVAK